MDNRIKIDERNTTITMIGNRGKTKYVIFKNGLYPYCTALGQYEAAYDRDFDRMPKPMQSAWRRLGW